MQVNEIACITMQISHVAIKADDIELSCKFYELILGLRQGERPPFGYPGAWLYAANDKPIIHLYGGEQGTDFSGNPYLGTLAVDHISINCLGYSVVIDTLKRIGLDWREYDVPKTSTRQVFVYDPNGVLLELNFNKEVEIASFFDKIPDQRLYVANIAFFNHSYTRSAFISYLGR